ncbi:MAG: hypothetical protein Kapaf2KO_13350 [Candidatus Kapaibacteriales bacterium]
MVVGVTLAAMTAYTRGDQGEILGEINVIFEGTIKELDNQKMFLYSDFTNSKGEVTTFDYRFRKLDN